MNNAFISYVSKSSNIKNYVNQFYFIFVQFKNYAFLLNFNYILNILFKIFKYGFLSEGINITVFLCKK